MVLNFYCSLILTFNLQIMVSFLSVLILCILADMLSIFYEFDLSTID